MSILEKVNQSVVAAPSAAMEAVNHSKNSTMEADTFNSRLQSVAEVKHGRSSTSQKSRRNIMRRSIMFLVFFYICVASAFAQDVIFMKNGDEIQAVVSEIGTDEVKYKRFDNQGGPTYTLKKSDIFMIRYANGSKDVFNEPATARPSAREFLKGIGTIPRPADGNQHNDQQAEEQRRQEWISMSWRENLKNAISTNGRNTDNGIFKGENTSDGMGAYLWNNGDTYIGNFRDNSAYGQGIFIIGSVTDNRNISNCPNAKYYVGSWSGGVKVGTGRCYDASGKLIYNGEFRDDKPTGSYPSTGNYSAYKFEPIILDNYNKLIGEILNGRLHGYSIIVWQDGRICFSWWKDGIINDTNICIENDGSVVIY